VVSTQRTVAAMMLSCLPRFSPRDWDDDGNDDDDDSLARRDTIWHDALESPSFDEEELACPLEKGFAEARPDKGWLLAHASEPLEVSYRHERGSGVHSLKVEAELDFPIDRVFAMGWEFELFDAWNPFAIDPTIVRRRESDDGDGDAMEMTVCCACWLPWPFSPRGLCVRIKTTDRLEDRGCYFQQIHDVEYENEAAATDGRVKRERASVVKGSFVSFSPIRSATQDGSGSTKVLICGHFDPYMMAPPQWLVTFVLRLMTPVVFQHLVKALKKAYSPSAESPSTHAKRVRTKSLYADMRDRVQEVVFAV